MNISLLFFLLLSSQASAQQTSTFPNWNPNVQTWDAAGLLESKSKKRVAEIQNELKSRYNIGLWVVTISSQAQYAKSSMSIERFAQSLVLQKIRPLVDDDDFVLLLVSRGDQKSRIELGPGWANRWNDSCDRITQQVLIPSFSQEHYDSGIVDGVESLAQMIQARRNQTLSQDFWDFSERWGSKYSRYSLLSPIYILPFTILGLAFFLLSFTTRDSKLAARVLGLGIIAISFFTTIIFGAGAVIFVVGAVIYSILNPNSNEDEYERRRRRESSSSSSAKSSSGGGGSSSSSGYRSGGGSTGSW